MGAPLGVCVNCVAPISKGMYESGQKIETVLATMFSSLAELAGENLAHGARFRNDGRISMIENHELRGFVRKGTTPGGRGLVWLSTDRIRLEVS